MGAEKLSISLDADLAEAVRAAAADEEVSVSTWLARAAEAGMRRRALGEALGAFAAEHGTLSDEEMRSLIDRARERSRVTRVRKHRP